MTRLDHLVTLFRINAVSCPSFGLLSIFLIHRPALKHVYLLEFHPSLSLLHKVTTAIDAVKQVSSDLIYCNTIDLPLSNDLEAWPDGSVGRALTYNVRGREFESR